MNSLYSWKILISHRFHKVQYRHSPQLKRQLWTNLNFHHNRKSLRWSVIFQWVSIFWGISSLNLGKLGMRGSIVRSLGGSAHQISLIRKESIKCPLGHWKWKKRGSKGLDRCSWRYAISKRAGSLLEPRKLTGWVLVELLGNLMQEVL